MRLEDHIRAEATRLGFDAVGLARAEPIDAGFLKRWIGDGYHAEMAYLARSPEARLDPSQLLEGAKTVVSVALNYLPPGYEPGRMGPKISRYAVGRDYHLELPERLTELLESIQAVRPGTRGRLAVDAQPTCDKVWAQLAGVGWIGKHSNVLRRGLGSWFFLGELFLDVELEPDAPATDHCGTCTACIDACPTQAIVADGVVDAGRCISYWTIEKRAEIPEPWRERLEDWIFGCDVCQEVCPWNREAPPTHVDAFHAREQFATSDATELIEAAQQNFKRSFPQSALERTRRGGLLRNLAIWLAHQPSDVALPLLQRLATDRDPNVQEHARWALERINTHE
ncbi:MAG: tRNA epoxyqueuosine(34) reductase QueG [Planctomycetota bacterium]